MFSLKLALYQERRSDLINLYNSLYLIVSIFSLLKQYTWFFWTNQYLHSVKVTHIADRKKEEKREKFNMKTGKNPNRKNKMFAERCMNSNQIKHITIFNWLDQFLHWPICRSSTILSSLIFTDNTFYFTLYKRFSEFNFHICKLKKYSY